MPFKTTIFQDKASIEKWFKKYAPGAIYHIYENKDKNSQYPFSVNIRGNFDISNKKITYFPFQFDTITGAFFCANNLLINLEGAPCYVEGNFDCSNNRLESLKGAPHTVLGGFWCHHNRLSSLEYAPRTVCGGYDCSYNQLTTLKGSGIRIESVFNCNHNLLTSLEHGPLRVDKNYYAEHNPFTSFYPFTTQLGQGIFITHDNNATPPMGLDSFSFDPDNEVYLLDEQERLVLQEKLMLLSQTNTRKHEKPSTNSVSYKNKI